MVPPVCYAELTKPMKDFFTKYYHIGVGKLEFKRKSESGVDMNAVTSVVSETGKSTAFLEMKCRLAKQGLTLKEKWLTDNTLNTEIHYDDCLLQGMKLMMKLHFNPQTKQMTGVAGAGLKGDSYHATTELDYSNGSPHVNASLVYAHNGFLAGSLINVCTSEKKATKTNMIAGYSGEDMTMLVNMNDFKVFGASVITHVKPDVQAAVLINWDSSTDKPAEFAIGGLYEASKDTVYRGKLSNLGTLGLSVSHKLRDGIELTICAGLELKDFHQSTHKLGLGLNIEG